MRIVSYNVNGIRSALRKGLIEWLRTVDPDVLCIQELKANPEQIPSELFTELGFVHQQWHSAEKKGYSGVAVLSKIKPNDTAIGIGDSTYDIEGRVVRMDFDLCSVVSVYVPSASNMERLDYKLAFMEALYSYAESISDRLSVICGDFNICHHEIDIHDPVRNKNVSGFLPVEREWMTRFIEMGYVDTFRHMCSDPHHYTWWSYRAQSRAKNKGWRLDYQMIPQRFRDRIHNAEICSQAVHSDHCPVLLDIC